MSINTTVLVGLVAALASTLLIGCAEPERPVRSMEITGRVIAPPGVQGPVEVRLYHAWSLEGELRHPLQWIDTFETTAGETFTHSFDYPLDRGEGLVVWAWIDTDGDGVHCTPTVREDLSGLTEAPDADSASVEVEVMLTEACRAADWFYPPGPVDAVSAASPQGPPIDNSMELPVRLVPNIPPAAEAYYAPDDYHFIAQARDPDAQTTGEGRIGGALTYIFSEDGKVNRRINDRGQDACSYFFPDQERVIWTSTRDNMDMPLGDWSDAKNYPQGAELYTSDLHGNDVVRLTNNEWYDAEVTVSPNGEWIVFARQIDGNINLWRMRADGSDETQITFTEDWQPGAPFYMPDNETILFQAWRASEHGKIEPTPMTVFTIKADGTDLKQRTFTRDMHWGPAPAGDGRHYLYTTVIDGYNWELFLGDLAGGEPLRLTYNAGFDGMKSFSKDSSKMLFVRTAGEGNELYTHVMDLSSLNLGAENYSGIPETPVPDDAVLVTDFTAGS